VFDLLYGNNIVIELLVICIHIDVGYLPMANCQILIMLEVFWYLSNCQLVIMLVEVFWYLPNCQLLIMVFGYLQNCQLLIMLV
jgi:hypothetical protein